MFEHRLLAVGSAARSTERVVLLVIKISMRKHAVFFLFPLHFNIAYK